jgi:hypothetical protein
MNMYDSLAEGEAEARPQIKRAHEIVMAMEHFMRLGAKELTQTIKECFLVVERIWGIDHSRPTSPDAVIHLAPAPIRAIKCPVPVWMLDGRNFAHAHQPVADRARA